MSLCSSFVTLTLYLLQNFSSDVEQIQFWANKYIFQSSLASMIQRLFIVERFPVTTILPLLKKTGFWRNYGFGITCIYKGDLVRVGGFDVSIQGWGLEDVDLFNKVVQAGLKTFRSQEVGVVHVHHPVFCDPNLDPKQYKMCLGSKASTYGSTQQLAEMWLEKNDPNYSKSSNNGSVRTA